MHASRHLPDPSRVSILTASILLAFALTRVITAPHYELTIPLAGFYVNLSLNFNTLVVLLAAGMTATGMNWLLQTHPSLEKGETREHWLLSTLTVVVIGVALYTIPSTPLWWIGFGLGALVLLVIFYAEFVAVDPTDVRYPLATTILTVSAFVMFLTLAIALRASNARLYLIAPALLLGSGLVALRTLHLRLNERWEGTWAIGIALITVQLGAALYYLPLTAVRFGLGLLGPLYALTSLAVSLAEGNPIRQAILEPAVMLILLSGLMVWFH